MALHGRPLPEVSVHSENLDEAREVGTRVLHRHRVTVLGRPSRFGMTLDATSLGPLTVGWLTYDTPVRIESAHSGYYQVNIASAGTMLAASVGEEVIADAGLATVYRPDRPAVFAGWQQPAPVLALRIAKRALEGQLEHLLDRTPRQPPELALGVHVADGRGAQWLALVRSLADALTDQDALIRQPMMAAPFTHSVLTGLLMITKHQYRDELAAPAPAAGSATVRAAKAYFEAHASRPLAVTDIARAAGVGVRGLQQAFHRTLDMSPMQYLRQVRLGHAHRELLAADSASTTVAEVARSWGFSHHGRFAGQYRERFGETPAEALRRRR